MPVGVYIRTKQHGQNISKATKGMPKSLKARENIRLSMIGKKGPLSRNWQGGITELRQRIRSLNENTYWQMSVFSRDNFTCQHCGIRGCYLEAHHKKPFAQVYKEFLQMYSQFSPIEEIDILLRLSLSYAPFWDIENGETLCRDCHKEVTYNRN